jgi:hypothetical protein
LKEWGIANGRGEERYSLRCALSTPLEPLPKIQVSQDMQAVEA